MVLDLPPLRTEMTNNVHPPIQQLSDKLRGGFLRVGYPASIGFIFDKEMDGMGFREEKDTMGTVRVPENAYYGAQTRRAVEKLSHQRVDLPAGIHPCPGPDQKMCCPGE
jgi:cellulase/cellobiase CelA1